MTASASYFDRKPSSTPRPGLAHLQPDPASPHTPQQRTISSAFSSPSLSYRTEEEPLVFEFGARHLSAGFTGESYPRCKLGFGPEESKRVGDYRQWLPGYDERPRTQQRIETWGEGHELWRMDLRGFDLGLMEDKIERAVRTAFTKYLLLDSKSRRLLVILPSVLPHQLLSTMLSTLFNNFQSPSITLMSPPVLSTVAAGCRSSMIVDVGWRETMVTAVYDYREVCQARTTRAMRMVTLEMARLLESYDTDVKRGTLSEAMEDCKGRASARLSIEFEQAEQVTARMAWCRSRNLMEKASSNLPNNSDRFGQILVTEGQPKDNPLEFQTTEDPSISLPSPSSPRHGIRIPFSKFAEPVEKSLLAATTQRYDLDDNEQPLHTLIYRSLLSLPLDVRAICMSRVIVTGGGSHIPGLKPRLLDELSAIVEDRGWDAVQGKAADKQRKRLNELNANRRMAASTTDKVSKDSSATVPASLAPQTPDPIADKTRREMKQGSKTTAAGVIRGIETTGAWAGGSLVANLRIKGLVEIERDSFLQYGLAGARRETETSAMQQKAYGAGDLRSGIGEKGGWTLGAWA